MSIFALAAALALAPAPPQAVEPACRPGAPAVLVRISGFKNRAGQVRVRVFGGAASTYFDKRQALVRIEVPVPRSGPVAMCVAVPKPGVYAVDVRHDVNGNGKTDRADGGGTSGNPPIGLFDVLFKRKPDPALVRVTVGDRATVVPVTLKYLDGASFKPVTPAN